jgi:predicted HTH transcriptional regulator
MKELMELIFAGESNTLDFKKHITDPNRIARTIASFANTRGGQILVGVMDNGQISGIDPEEEKHLLLIAAEHFCNPPVKIFFKELEVEDKTVLKVIVPESLEKSHLVKVNENDWRGYIRVNDETVQCSNLEEKMRDPELPSEAEIQFPLQEKLLLAYLQNKRRITEKQFIKLVNLPQRHAHRILVKLVKQGSICIQDQEKVVYFTSC